MSRRAGRGILPGDYAIIQARDAKRTAETIAAKRLIGVDVLTTTASAGYVQAELQAVIDRLNEVIRALQNTKPV